jgi:hypothetical protein
MSSSAVGKLSVETMLVTLYLVGHSEK